MESKESHGKPNETVKKVSFEEQLMMQVPNSPFMSVKDGEEYVLIMGKYRMSEKKFKSHKEITEFCSTINYDLILGMIAILIEPRETKNN